MISLALVVVLTTVLAVVAFQSRRAAGGGSPVAGAGPGRVSLLTEAVAYVGAVLVVAGGATAVGQRWSDVSDGGRVATLSGGAVLFLVAGALVRQVAEPAVQRLVGVLWFVSVGAAAAATGVAAAQVVELSGEAVALCVGLGTVVYGGLLWWLRRHALQQVAVLVGAIVASVGAVGVLAGGEPPTLPSALVLWALGTSWALGGWRRHVEPTWAAVPMGVLLALYSPTVAVGEHGWYYAVAVGTAVAVMAVSVPARNPVLLGMGTVAAFGYTTAAVVRYFGDDLGVPAALSLTGLLVLGLALVTARLLKAARPAPPVDDDDADGGSAGSDQHMVVGSGSPIGTLRPGRRLPRS